ncbi:MAG TPA: TonB-dependent receptor plug domain-containing protein [Azospirillaceae bacterium]|nr:TonB-dependent receptor plug domain-containing protein [Azospirillaceae bacterium]
MRQEISMNGRLRTLLGGTALLALGCGSASAQAIDYGSLQQLFGEPVTTSAIGKPQRVSDVPATMQIISGEEVRRSGAYTIPQVLNRVAGVFVMNTGTGTESVSMRGYNVPAGSRILVMVNGRHTFSDDIYTTTWPSIPVEMDDIQQIEVIKGPAGAMFGFNALLGVINIITKNPRLTEGDTATVRAGNMDYRQLSVSKTLKLSDAAGIRLSAGLTESDQFKYPEIIGGPSFLTDNANRFITASQAERQSVAGDLAWALLPGTELRVEASWNDKKGSWMWQPWLPVYEDRETWSLRSAISSDSAIGLLNLTAYTNSQSLGFKTAFEGDLLLKYTNDTYVLRADDTVKLNESHTVRAAFEYRRATGKGIEFGPPGATVNHEIFAASGMWNWDVTPTVTLTNAVRIDRARQWRSGPMIRYANLTNDDYRRVDYEPSFNSYLSWRPTAVDSIRLTAGKAVQTASMMKGALQSPGDFTVFLGTPSIEKNHTNTALELAYDRRIDAIGGGFRASVWRQYAEGNIGFSSFPDDPNSLPLIFRVVKEGDTELTGLELELTGRVQENWNWSVNYGWIDENDDLTMLNFGGQTINFHQGAQRGVNPKHKIGAAVAYTSGPWDLSTNIVYNSGYFAYGPASPERYAIPAFVELNGRLAYSLNSWATVSLDGYNLVDEHLEASGLKVGSRYSVSLQFRF